MQLINLRVLASNISSISESIFTRYPRLSAFILGLCLKNSFNEKEQFIWIILAIPLLLHILRLTNSKKTFVVGFCFGYGYFFSTLYWIAESCKCVGMGVLGYFAILPLVAYLALYPALTCYFSCKIKPKTLQRLSFPLLWTIGEIIRGYLFTGFPWNLIGYATYRIPYFAQIADLVSVYGVTFLFLLILILFTKKTYKYSVILMVSIMGYGYFRVSQCSGKANLPNITIVQPSINQKAKLDPQNFWDNLDLQIAMSQFGSDKQRLIIWSEAAVGTSANPYILKYIASHLGQDEILITGIDREEHGKIYNSVIAINHTGEVLQCYNKRHLVPFGEYIPIFLSKLGLNKITAGMVNFSEGVGLKTFNLPNIPQFDINICYEIIMPRQVLDTKSSKWILTVSNDAWFGHSDGPYQHMKTACFRAIEERKPIVRCANNGISCVINSDGTIIKKLALNAIGIIQING